MARLSDQVQVKVNWERVEDGKRKLAMEIEVSEELFYLSDALVREGVVKELRTELRSCVRSGVVNYIQQSRELIKQLGASEKSKEIGKAR